MENLQGSATFRLFSYGAFFFFVVHVFIQWAITKLFGPYGKKSAAECSQDKGSSDTLEYNKNEGGREKLDDGFKDVDLRHWTFW